MFDDAGDNYSPKSPAMSPGEQDNVTVMRECWWDEAMTRNHAT